MDRLIKIWIISNSVTSKQTNINNKVIMVHVFPEPLVVLPLLAGIDAVTCRFWNQCGHDTYTLFFLQLNLFLAALSGIGFRTGSHHRPHTACPPAPPCQYPRTEGASNWFFFASLWSSALSVLATNEFVFWAATKISWSPMGSLTVFIYFSVCIYANPDKLINVGQFRGGSRRSLSSLGKKAAWFAFEGRTTGTLEWEHVSCCRGLRDLSIRGETQSRQERMTSICILRNGGGGGQWMQTHTLTG